MPVWPTRGTEPRTRTSVGFLQRGGDVARRVRLDGYTPEDLLVLDVLGSGRAQALHDQVEALVLGWPDVVVVDRRAQRLARAGALRLERQDLAAAGQRDRGRRATVDHPNHHSLSAAVLEILLDRVRERARLPEPPEYLLVIREAVEQDRLVDRSANGASDKAVTAPGRRAMGWSAPGPSATTKLRTCDSGNQPPPPTGTEAQLFSSHSHNPVPPRPR